MQNDRSIRFYNTLGVVLQWSLGSLAVGLVVGIAIGVFLV